VVSDCCFVERERGSAVFSYIGTSEIIMGRKSRAQKIIDSIEKDIESEFQYLIVYDFRKIQATNRFWTNLNEIIGRLGGEMLQYSVYFGPIKGAIAVHDLVEGYGGEAAGFVILKNFERRYVRNS